MRELLARIGGSHFAHQYLCVLRHFETGKFCDRICRLAYDFRVQRAVDDDRLPHLLRLRRREKISPAKLHFLLELRVNLLRHDYRLFRRADHSVIKGLGMEYGRNRKRNIRRHVHHRGRVSRTDPDGGLPRRICRANHAGAARRQNRVRFLHDHSRKLNARLVDPADDFVRSSRFYRRLQNHLRRFDRAFLRPGMRGNNQPVPRL